MKGDPEQRALLLGEYIVEHGATVRAAARAFGCSKSTVHKDVSVRLRTVGPELFRQVQRMSPSLVLPVMVRLVPFMETRPKRPPEMPWPVMSPRLMQFTISSRTQATRS